MERVTRQFASDESYTYSLSYSLFDAIFIALMMGAGEYYFGAYALALGATAFQMGFLGSLPVCLGSLVQVFSPRITNLLQSRKRAVLIPNIIRTVIWAGIIAASQFAGEARIWFLIGLITLYYCFGYLTLSPWTSWMGDLLDESKRPHYFSLRNRISTVVSLLAVVGAGIFLEFQGVSSDNPVTGFFIIFSIATVSSLLATIVISNKVNIPHTEDWSKRLSLLNFSKNLFMDSFGRFTIFNLLFYFGLYIAVPFFIVYQLNILDFTYIELMIAFAMTFIGKYLFYPVWSSLIATYGNAKILSGSIFVISLLPLLWVFFAQSSPAVYALNFVAGIGWSGFELLGFNFVFDTVRPRDRTRSSSYLTFYRGIAILFGGSLGAFLSEHLGATQEAFFLLFGISAFIRLLAFAYFLRSIDDLKTFTPILFQRMIVDVFTRLPRQGTRVALIGLKTTHKKMNRISDRSTSFLEESEEDED